MSGMRRFFASKGEAPARAQVGAGGVRPPSPSSARLRKRHVAPGLVVLAIASAAVWLLMQLVQSKGEISRLKIQLARAEATRAPTAAPTAPPSRAPAPTQPASPQDLAEAASKRLHASFLSHIETATGTESVTPPPLPACEEGANNTYYRSNKSRAALAEVKRVAANFNRESRLEVARHGPPYL